MKKRVCLLALIVNILMNVSTAFVDDVFYVIAGGGISGKVLKTQVFTSNTQNDTLGTDSWAQLSDPQWTYTKLSATSYLVITYQDNIWCTGDFGAFSLYQVRVNRLVSVAGENSAMLVASGGWNLSGTTGVWTGLPQGDVNLSIWHYQINCTACIQNPSELTTNVLVMEIGK
jgi:hypothetical protein